ncbi:hypothetical protein D3C85_960830 [compost metagenome]
MGAGRQGAHLVRHHRKTAPLLAGPGRLDGGVEGQQVGLLRHPPDHVEHRANLLGLLLEPAHRLHRLHHLVRQLADGLPGLGHHLAPVLGEVERGVRRLGGLGCVLAHFAAAHRHLLHGAGHPQGILLLAGDDGACPIDDLSQLVRLLPVLGRDLLAAPHQLRHLTGEEVEVDRELAQLVPARLRQPKTQIPLPSGDVAEGRYRLGEGHHYAAHYEPDHGKQQEGQHQAYPEQGAQHLLILGFDVVHIDAGADDPVPGGEALDVGDLAYRLLHPGLWPVIGYLPRALRPRQIGEGHEQPEPLFILHPGEILAVQLGFHGVHHHGGVAVVDPEVVVGAIAQPLDQCEGLGLGTRLVELSLAHPGLQPRHQAVGGLDLGPGLAALLPHQPLLIDLQAEEQQQSQQRQHHQGHQRQAPADTPLSQHTLVPNQLHVVNKVCRHGAACPR